MQWFVPSAISLGLTPLLAKGVIGQDIVMKMFFLNSIFQQPQTVVSEDFLMVIDTVDDFGFAAAVALYLL